MAEITLIANTGIQFYKTNVWVDLRNNNVEKMTFHEWFDSIEIREKVELAQGLDDVVLRKTDLYDQGFLDANGNPKMTWEEIRMITSDIEQFPEEEVFSMDINRLQHRGNNDGPSFLDKFTNKWLPLPYFERNSAGKFLIGPFNWSRVRIVPTGRVEDDKTEWTIVLAFDTAAKVDNGDVDDDYHESPLFSNQASRFKKFGLSSNELDLMRFVTAKDGCSDWIDNYVLRLAHNVIDVNDVQGDSNGLKYQYLGAYVYLIKYLQRTADLPFVILYSGLNVETVGVDLVVDVGNSKTTAILFHNGDFTKADQLKLQDFTRPEMETESPFDMNLVFQNANFGDMQLGDSLQFKYPSLVRLGSEAKYLIFHATDEQSGGKTLSVCSSPKRYLWDQRKRRQEWEPLEVTGEVHVNTGVRINGISDQLNDDGTLNCDGFGGSMAHYSRSSLMTLAFLEIICQARMQINSYEYRMRRGDGDAAKPRRISKVIVTCPTTMSNREQIALRKAAADAQILLKRYCAGTFYEEIDYKDELEHSNVIPSVRDLKDLEERPTWTYDEATASQFVFLCAEIVHRYQNNADQFFNLYGHINPALPDERRSITIGSLDIGAGTTDLMICNYSYSTAGQTTLTPQPLFWESFYIAGDDMLQSFVQQIVIEGPFAKISNHLQQLNSPNVSVLLADFFGGDTGRLDYRQRQRRKNFNLQVSVPIAQTFLEEARRQTEHKLLKWDDFFPDNHPNQYLLDAFEQHFGFRIEELEWEYDIAVVNSLISAQFDSLLKKVASVMAAYRCDIVLLAGRPTSLKQIENIFLKYYPVAPNRLKLLNDYRVGRWYPFQDGNGYFGSPNEQKSTVAVGALLGYIASTQGGYRGLTFDFSKLRKTLVPTTDFFGIMQPCSNVLKKKDVLLSPKKNSVSVQLPSLPVKIGTRQLDTEAYPARSFYSLDFDDYVIANSKENNGIEGVDEVARAAESEKIKIRSRMPLVFEIDRENYPTDKEMLKITSVTDSLGNSIPPKYFSLQINSLNEREDYWLDSGAFNLSIQVH